MKKLAVAPALFCLALQAFAADEAVSPPVGGMTVTLAAAVNGVPKTSTFTPALRMPASGSFIGKVRGALTGVTATTLSDSTAGWSAGGLSTAATPYCIRITSGAAAGTWWQVSTSTASTATTATVTNRGINPVAAGIVVGDTYEIVPVDTLSTLFSAISSQIGGIAAASADLVQVHDGVQWREYYFNTSFGQWREGTATFNRNNVVVRPDYAIVFIRRAGTPVSLTMLGNVSTAGEKIAVSASGVSPVGSVYPVIRTLGSLGIENSPNFVRFTGDLVAADKVNIFDGVNWRIFHYNQSFSQWREGTSSFNRNAYSLPLGAAVVIERGTAASSPFFVSLNPPYSL